ncbi:MAG: PQQ-binding-like beta-propeller repeat protein [Candidatus Latescibacteria bacterium]|nr:PQQ-binding-like beta-propeller repeat protein [Candidatus Latescibacterota bacterium]
MPSRLRPQLPSPTTVPKHLDQSWWKLVQSLLFALLLVGPSWAGKAELRQTNTYDRFAEGELEGIALSPEPALRLAPPLEEATQLDVDRIWSLTQGQDGALLYAGAGDSGQIWALDAQGQSRLLFDSPELAIHDLLVGADGVLYAGTSPDGLIYRIDAAGEATTLAQTQTHYVWDLALGPKGQLYAATGEDGRVLSIDAAGEARVVADLPDQHVMALAVADDRLYAATANKGRVYEITLPNGPPRLLFEADQEEIHDLVRAPGGDLYVSGLNAVAEPGKARTALYRLALGGAARLLWQDDKARIADLLVLDDGRLLMASSDPARIYRLEAPGAMSLLANLAEGVPNRLLALADGTVYLGAAQGGQLWRLGRRFSSSGQFESAVEDFQGVAQWGRIGWRGQTPKKTAISLQTRSGNSAEPDETWSPWSQPLQQGGAIDSPAARYLQYRAQLTSDDDQASPLLQQVELFGLPANLPPEIIDLQTYPYRAGQPTGNGGAEPQGANQALNNGNARRSPPLRSSLRLVRWQGRDGNRDQLSYSLYLRSSDQRHWKLVEEDLPQTSVIWDTATMPEGMTQLKLVASDRPAHPAGMALEAERITPPFPIDNSPPRLKMEVKGRTPLRLQVVIEDRITPILKAQYKIDYGDRAHQLAPVDGIFDSQREEVGFSIADLAPGEHVIVVQAWDQLDNVGAQQLVVLIE